MNLQKPQVTDAVASLNQRVTALESGSYDDNSPVDMFKLFTENAFATDTFIVYTHQYLCCTSQTVAEDTGQYVFITPGQIDQLTVTTPVLVCSPDTYI